MEEQGKRLLLAAALALAVMFLWGKIFPPPTPEKPQAAANDQTAKPAPTKATRHVGTRTDGSAPPSSPQLTPASPVAFQSEHLAAEFSATDASVTKWTLLDDQFKRSENKGAMLAGPAFTLNFIRSTVALPSNLVWQQEANDKGVTYRYQDADLRIAKSFTLDPNTLSLRIRVELENVGTRELRQRLVLSIPGAQDPKADTEPGFGGKAARDWRAACFRDEVHSVTLADLAQPRSLANATWGGFRHPYLVMALAPKPVTGEPVSCSAYRTSEAGAMAVDLEYPEYTLRPGDPMIQRELVAYIGPKFYSRMEAVDDIAGYPTRIRDSVDFGYLGFLARPMLWVLQKSHKLVGNWGIAIILLTILVKLLTLPWVTSSMRSMKRMTQLRPEIENLQKRYGDDRNKLNTEMMALYKQHKVNPIAGCLPMILQMPIWFALYRMLSTAGELYHAKFLWMTDLTDSDPLHIIPVILTAAMFAQSKLSPQTGDSMQQKMLVYGMPLMFGVMSFLFPAGLSVYILTNTALSIAHTVYMNRTEPAPTPATAPTSAPAPVLATAAAASSASSAGDAPRENAPAERRQQAPRSKRKSKSN